MALSTSTIERITTGAVPEESIGAALLYGLVAGLLFPWVRYRIDPDTISYLSIAQKYLRGIGPMPSTASGVLSIHGS